MCKINSKGAFMLKNAINIAKGADEEKVPVSLKVPKSLKEEFEILCKEQGVSMNSMFCALAQIAVNESKGVEVNDQPLLDLLKELDKLRADEETAIELMEAGGNTIMTTDGKTIDLEEALSTAQLKIKALKAEIARRSK